MNRRQQGGTLSERLRNEVQVSAALWQADSRADDEKVARNVQRIVHATEAKSAAGPPQAKSPLFFYKYLQPIATRGSLQRKLRVNLPLTVVCEPSDAQETVLWLRTDAHGHIIREERTPLWRKTLSSELLSGKSDTERDPLLAVRGVARWKNSQGSSGGSAIVLTKSTLESVLAAPCERPTCIQQFIHCRGMQPSVYRIFWCTQSCKCFAVNLTISLRNTDVRINGERIQQDRESPAITMLHKLSGSTKNPALEAALATAAQTAQLYCVTVSPDERACARWPKLRGTLIAKGVEATSRIVEHVQMRLSAVRFHSMTVDFIKDSRGVWWLMRVVDFKASSLVEIATDNKIIDMQDSAVLLPETIRLEPGVASKNSLLESMSRGSTLVRDSMNSRLCFLCGCSCELTLPLKTQLDAMLQGESYDEYNKRRNSSKSAPSCDDVRMTLTMALDTIFLMRQRGVSLSPWEHAVKTVRKSQLRDQCDFPTCLLCYRIYQQQCCLQVLAKELHSVLSPTAANVNGRLEESLGVLNANALEKARKAIVTSSGLETSQLLTSELHNGYKTLQIEAGPPLSLRKGYAGLDASKSLLKPLRGADLDPTASQLRLVIFFHELQDAGPDLIPTDFHLEYQLGQSVTRIQLEGSKRHTPNRWQLCEARVHYLCATLDAFRVFCAQNQVLIKLKTQFRVEDEECIRSTCMENENLVGFTLLSLQAVATTANLMEDSLYLGSRTDYLLELHTASHGILTLKLTVGLLVDPVPLSQVRDAVLDLLFLEEQQPRGVYWPPVSHFLTGLPVPQDWVHTLMPSEYTKQSPMLRKGARRTHRVSVSAAPTAILTPFHPKRVFSRRTSAEIGDGEKYIKKSASCDDICDDASADLKLVEYRSLSLSVARSESTLSLVCLTAKRMIFRVTEDAATANFPTLMLAIILRNASFAITWQSRASFQFTRRYSLDRLLAEVKSDLLPMLALVGELMLVLLENQELPALVDASALAPLLEPFWKHESGWRSIPRTQSSCLPHHRVMWNRAIRRWKAAGCHNGLEDETARCTEMVTCSEGKLDAAIGKFRAQKVALTLCELFEQMESLDSDYIDIAELRSLAKCTAVQIEGCTALQLDLDMGMRERLRQEDVKSLAALIDQQRRLALWTLLHSLMNSSVLLAALLRFDQSGSGEMNFEKFYELSSEALLSQRNVFRTFQEEPTKLHDGFCLRHGLTEIYIWDSVCIHCAVGNEASLKWKPLSDNSSKDFVLIQADSDTKLKAAKALKCVSEERKLSKTNAETALNAIGTQRRKSLNIRRASAPEVGEFRADSVSTVSDETFESDPNVGFGRRQDVAEETSTSRHMDEDFYNVMNQRPSTERARVISREQAKELESCTTSLTLPNSDLSEPAQQYRRLTVPTQMVGQVTGSKKTKKIRLKSTILTKTAHRTRVRQARPTSESLSKLLRLEFCELTLTTGTNQAIIAKTIQLNQRRKELDRLVVAEVHQVQERLAKLLDKS